MGQAASPALAERLPGEGVLFCLGWHVPPSGLLTQLSVQEIYFRKAAEFTPLAPKAVGWGSVKACPATGVWHQSVWNCNPWLLAPGDAKRAQGILSVSTDKHDDWDSPCGYG